MPKAATSPRSSARTSPGSRRVTRAAPALGPGLHAGVVERALPGEAGYVVRLSGGETIEATLDVGVAAALVDECMRGRRTVLLADVGGAPAILGALQTTPSARVDDAGDAALAGKTVALEAADRITLKVGASVVSLEKDGALRIQGDRLTIDVGALVRILSANVQLP